MNVVKEVKVTESFLGLDSDVKGCNMEETLTNKNLELYFYSPCKTSLKYSTYFSNYRHFFMKL